MVDLTAMLIFLGKSSKAINTIKSPKMVVKGSTLTSLKYLLFYAIDQYNGNWPQITDRGTIEITALWRDFSKKTVFCFSFEFLTINVANEHL